MECDREYTGYEPRTGSLACVNLDPPIDATDLRCGTPGRRLWGRSPDIPGVPTVTGAGWETRRARPCRAAPGTASPRGRRPAGGLCGVRAARTVLAWPSGAAGSAHPRPRRAEGRDLDPPGDDPRSRSRGGVRALGLAPSVAATIRRKTSNVCSTAKRACPRPTRSAEPAGAIGRGGEVGLDVSPRAAARTRSDSVPSALLGVPARSGERSILPGRAAFSIRLRRRRRNTVVGRRGRPTAGRLPAETLAPRTSGRLKSSP